QLRWHSQCCLASSGWVVAAKLSRSRRACAREFCLEVPSEDQRAQGMPGARRARSLACKIKKHTSIVTTVTPDFTRHSPRDGFNGFLRALVSEKSGRMCERAAIDQPPVAGSEPVRAQRLRA